MYLNCQVIGYPGAMEEPRWLTAEERETWLAVLGLLIRLPAALDTQLQRDAGMSSFEYQVMAGLCESPDRTMRMSVLALLANGSLSPMSPAVNRLEPRTSVTRRTAPGDG